MCDAGITTHDQRRLGDRGGELGQRGAAGEYRVVGQAGGGGYGGCQRPLGRTAGHHDASAALGQLASDRRIPVVGPAPGGEPASGMHDDRPRCRARNRGTRQRQI